MSAIKYPKNHDLRELISFSAETGHICWPKAEC